LESPTSEHLPCLLSTYIFLYYIIGNVTAGSCRTMPDLGVRFVFQEQRELGEQNFYF
jgi:hypothetical protein